MVGAFFFNWNGLTGSALFSMKQHGVRTLGDGKKKLDSSNGKGYYGLLRADPDFNRPRNKRLGLRQTLFIFLPFIFSMVFDTCS